MAMDIAANKQLNFALRALQLIFAIIIMGTDGYAITTFFWEVYYDGSDMAGYYPIEDVPGAWAFLMFCAAWTCFVVLFVLVAGIFRSNGRTLKVVGYTGIVLEVVAVLSWFAGFIAMAVFIPYGLCPLGTTTCQGSIVAATVFGGLEWLLFAISTTMAVRLVFSGTRQSMTSPSAALGRQSGFGAPVPFASAEEEKKSKSSEQKEVEA